MAIRQMTSEKRAGEPNVETVRDYPGHEDGRVRHCAACPHKGKSDKSGAHSPECVTKATAESGFDRCAIFGPLYMETTHKGLVLALGEYNGYDDSDFYAIVWDVEKREPARVVYASTRGWTYPNGATVDATDAVREAYNAYEAARAEAADKARQAAEAAEAARRATIPGRGDSAVVVGGRKVKKGTTGKVLWTGAGSYGHKRALFATTDRKGPDGRHLDAVYIDLRWLKKA